MLFSSTVRNRTGRFQVQQLEDRIAMAADAFEPNETANAAKDVGPGTTQLSLHTLLPPRDEDWFRIVANGPGTIT
ncbi:MAG: hypothetical protein ACRC1K_19640, partial [Planctomycetia bacterium]